MKFKKLDITIEPVIFLIALSCGLSTGQMNLILQKLCYQERFSHDDRHTDICVQHSTDMYTLKTMLKECLPMFPLILAGSWRDKHGKSIPLLILVIIGQIIGSFVNLISSVFWLKVSVLETVLFEGMVTGLTGSLPLVLMSSACFISNRTCVEDRTFRISLILASYLSGLTIGVISFGVIWQNLGFITLFSTALVTAIISLIYVFVFINETPAPSKQPLPLHSVFTTVIKKRKNNLRSVILLMILVQCLFGAAILCESNILLFFLEKSLKFSVDEAGLYSSYKNIILALSSFVAVPILSKYFKIDDILLGIISSIMNCISSLWAAFARNKLQLAFCPLGDLLRGAVYAVEKSTLSKYVGPNELGQILSAEFVIEAFCQLIFLPLYTYVYNITSGKFPGAFFLITTLFSLVILVSFCITKILINKNKKQLDLTELENAPEESAM